MGRKKEKKGGREKDKDEFEGVDAEYGYLSRNELERWRVLKNMITTYYGFQEVRKAMDSRLAGLIKEYIDFHDIAVKMKKDEKAAEEIEKRFGLDISESTVDEIETKIRRSTSLDNFAWITRRYTEFTEVSNMATIVYEAGKIESKIKRQIESWLPRYEIYNKWLRYVRGIGPIFAGGLIATIRDPRRFSKISKLWQYSGLGHVYFCTECMKYVTVKKVMTIKGEEKAVVTFGGRSAAEAHAESHGLKYDDCIVSMAQRRVSGIVSNWNPFMKTLCYLISDSFVKHGKYYRRAYDRFWEVEKEKAQQPKLVKVEMAVGFIPFDDGLKKAIMKRFECPSCGYREDKVMSKCPRCGKRVQALITAGRMRTLKEMGYDEIEIVPPNALVHKRAMRKTVKLFVAHLYDKWMRIEGEDPGLPYSGKILGHNFYPPPELDERGEI